MLSRVAVKAVDVTCALHIFLKGAWQSDNAEVRTQRGASLPGLPIGALDPR